MIRKDAFQASSGKSQEEKFAVHVFSIATKTKFSNEHARDWQSFNLCYNVMELGRL